MSGRRLAYHTVCLSPHQVPLARELVARLGASAFRLVCDTRLDADRVRLGWSAAEEGDWILEPGARDDESTAWLAEADMLVSSLRRPELFVRRLAQGRETAYASERWFKPIAVGTFHLFGRTRIAYLPGWVRLLSPSYFRTARQMTGLFASPLFRYLPIGPWAARDMRLACLLTGRFRRSARAFLPWVYTVAPSGPMDAAAPEASASAGTPKVLWVGRLIDWKRVDTLVRAVASCGAGLTLTIVGDGPEKGFLQALAARLGAADRVAFLPAQPIAAIRGLMRAHDIYVLASDAQEGWGAALNEALAEGMVAFGTFEAGASAAMLPRERLFHAGDAKALAAGLTRVSKTRELFAPSARRERVAEFARGPWTPASAAGVLLS